MKKYTKLCLATICFISSVSAFADGYKGEAPPLVPVSIPMFNGGFEFTIGALYMEPDSSNTNYLGTQYINSDIENTVDNRMDYGLDPNYQWGFVLGLGYVIPGTANDVKLDWTYFHNNYSASEYLLGLDGNGATDAVFFPTGDAELNGFSTLDAQGTMDYKFDAVDLTFGQYLNFGSRLQTRLFAGLRYMRLDSDLSTNYTYYDDQLVTAPVPHTQVLEQWDGGINSSFDGLGPLVGIKADYYLGAGFSLSGGIDGTLLVGQVSLDANAQHARQVFNAGVWSLDAADTSNLNWDDQNVIAPGFDAKFGFNYKYQFNNGTLLGLELGYQVTKYIDVIEEMDRASAPSLGVEPDRFDTDLSNFRLAGPYLTLNVKV